MDETPRPARHRIHEPGEAAAISARRLDGRRLGGGAVSLSAIEIDLECVEIVRAHALPIPPPARPAFYEKVSDLMRGVEPGPGSYARACREAQRSFIAIPDEKPTVDGRR